MRALKKAGPSWELLPNREKVAEDAHQCFYCTDFAYASMIKCTRCVRQYCIYHGLLCGCGKPHVSLVYRHSSEELQ